jgi:hypothetical protein
MCDYSPDGIIERILADELVRLAMASDGVHEDQMRRVPSESALRLYGIVVVG